MANHTVDCEHCGEDLRSSDHAPECVTKQRVQMDRDKTIGQIGYEAYHAATLRHGTQSPFHDRYEVIRDHWEAAASAVWDEAVEACETECFHQEQVQVWSDELLEELGLMDHLNPDRSYDDVVDMHKRVQDFLRDTVGRRLRDLKRVAESPHEERSDEISPHGPEVPLTHKINQDQDNG